MAPPASTAFAPLAGITVLERAGPLAVAACTHLLAALGARVVRLELPAEPERLAGANRAEQRLRTAGKERIALTRSACVAAWRERLDGADVLVLAPPGCDEPEHPALAPLLRGAERKPIVCSFSLHGLDQPGAPAEASDALVQALGGLMAVTGRKDGPPELVRVPVAHLSAAVIGVTAILAALAGRGRDGSAPLLDLSLVHVMADQLRTHIGLIETGRARGLRMGCEHPLCSPWNAYRARDGWLLVCSSGDAHWRSLAGLMQHPELARDPRFVTMKTRRENAAAIDALVQDWVGSRTRAAVVEALNAADVPVGPALDPRAVPADATLRACGTIATDPESGASVPGPFWRYRPASAASSRAQRSASDHRAAKEPSTASRGSEHAPADAPPLAGIRVIEFTRYAAGPLAGFALASLGAEVIKIEPPEGEECRTWSPRFGPVSGYFANYNALKRCAGADLRAGRVKRKVEALIAEADVVLHNMRPGAMDRLGLGAAELCARHPRLVYCAVSGFGPSGPALPALDTVVQGHLGLTALVGDGDVPIRIGYSIADQLAGHFAAAGIVAALRERARTGHGGALDIGMVDALAWLTHLAWNEDRPALPAATRLEAADGWLVAAAEAQAVHAACPDANAMLRAEAVAHLAACGIAAAPVLEADEVLQQPSLVRRRSLRQVPVSGDAHVPVFAAPLGMAFERPLAMTALEHDIDTMEWNPR